MGTNHRQGRNAVLRAIISVTAIAAILLIFQGAAGASAAPHPPPREDRSAARHVPDSEVRAALDAVYKDGRIQRELPEQKKPKIPDLRWLAPIARVLGWMLLAGLVIGLLVLIYLFLRGRFGFTRVREETSGEAPGQGSARTGTPGREPVLWGREALAEADRLAQAGNFAEAIHVLLLGGLADLRRRLARALPPALTSREILSRIEMPAAAREALAAMISLVELSHFGFRPVGADDYGRCRERFLAFAETEEAR